jgi:hypothetical protein
MVRYPEFDCSKCTDKQKVSRGCEQDAMFPYWSDLDGNQHTRCPRRPIYENPDLFNSYISVYNLYKSGYLPHAGGMNDQHCNYPMLMQTIDNAVTKCEEYNRANEAGKVTETVLPKGRR